MPQLGEVLIQGMLGPLLPHIETIDSQIAEGCWMAFGPAGAISLSDAMLTAIIFVPDYADDDWLPEFALEHRLEPVFDVHLMQSIIMNAKHQKPEVTLPELVAALNYFSEHDAFLNFSTQPHPEE